jgi:hypothetical protein
MTKPGSTNQIQLTPEGLSLVQTIAKRAGLPDGTIAANARVVSRHELEGDGVSLISMAHPAGPIFAIDGETLRPVSGAVLHDLRLGVSVMYQNGVAARWTIVMRRDGIRLCELDYADEVSCETERDDLSRLINARLKSDETFEIPTRAIDIRNYNPTNGQEL